MADLLDRAVETAREKVNKSISDSLRKKERVVIFVREFKVWEFCFRNLDLVCKKSVEEDNGIEFIGERDGIVWKVFLRDYL